MKKTIIGVVVAFVLVALALIIYSGEDKFEYYDTNNIYGTSKRCKVSDSDELVCKRGKEWIKVNQYSLMVN